MELHQNRPGKSREISGPQFPLQLLRVQYDEYGGSSLSIIVQEGSHMPSEYHLKKLFGFSPVTCIEITEIQQLLASMVAMTIPILSKLRQGGAISQNKQATRYT